MSFTSEDAAEIVSAMCDRKHFGRLAVAKRLAKALKPDPDLHKRVAATKALHLEENSRSVLLDAFGAAVVKKGEPGELRHLRVKRDKVFEHLGFVPGLWINLDNGTIVQGPWGAQGKAWDHFTGLLFAY